MKQENMLKIGLALMILVFALSFVSSATRSNPQYTQFMSGQTQEFDESMCQQGQDFIVQIAPFGCEPAVVRSDLLEEQNVPIFCQLNAMKINPLIDVEGIEGISFSGEYPPEVEGIAFHPAQAALGIKGDLTNPLLNNIGYVVIVLKQQSNASAMPDFVSGNLTAKIKYDVKNSFGIGSANFYLSEMTENEWGNSRHKYNFWDGKGTLRAESIEENSAMISVYSGDDKVSSVSLEKGEESEEIHLPGFDCLAGLQIKLNSLENPDTRAILRINSEVVEVAKDEKFLDNKCQITQLEKQGIIQRVKIKCNEDEGVKNFNLMIGLKINLSIDGEEKEVELGERFYVDGSNSIYLAYIGTDEESRKTEDLFIYLASKSGSESSLDGDELVHYSNLVGDADDEEFVRIDYGGVVQDVFGSKVIVNGFAEPIDDNIIDNIDYYQNAIDDYETIRESFVGEKYPVDAKETLDEKALVQEIILAWGTHQRAEVVKLCNDFEILYPNSKKDITTYCDNDYGLSNQEISVAYVTANGESKKISFDGIYEPSIEDYSVKIFVSNAEAKNGEKTLRKNAEVYVSGTEFIILKELDEDYATFDISNVESTSKKTSKYLKIEEGEYEIIGEKGYKISLNRINLKKSAKVSLSPGFEDAGTEASFGFNIGIEKRSFTLPPDKIREQIDMLNTQLGRWQNFSDGLGTVVKGLKTACLATGAGLVLKNFALNTGGAGIARRYVMRSAGGWYEKCVDISNSGGGSVDACLLEKADEIDAEVDLVTELLGERNREKQELEESIPKINVLGKEVVNITEFRMKYSKQVIDYWDDETYEDFFADPDGDGVTIYKDEIIKILSYEGWANKNYNEEKLMKIELWAKVLENAGENPHLQDMAKKELYSNLLDIKVNADGFVERKSFLDKYGFEEGYYGSTEKLKEISISKVKTFGEVKSKFLGASISDESYVYPFKDKVDRKEYLLVLDNDYFVKQTYLIDVGVLSPANEEDINPLRIGFQKYDASSYENKYKNAEVQFYETEPYKGLPAIVPFDLDNGWYAATKQTLPVWGNAQTYDKSGAVNSVWVCNVGKNNLEENVGGDDDCQMIRRDTGQPNDQFYGLDEIGAAKIIACAFDAIDDASRHKSGRSVSINTNCGGSINVRVGAPAVDIPEIECADLMSPKDCQLLFNVCDPVICPSSRCDLGGAYPVRDVVGSGIIGSLVLCLPNIQEGIFIPICLSGVHAGIDGWLSVKTAHRDCLQHSLDTGEMIGICDEINSIYMCEFFWRQVLPLADLALPKIIGALLGQGADGGGEYLSVANAWSTAQDSVTYFTQYYASGSSKAFNIRSTEEVGTEICKLSISAIYANGVDILDTMTEPASPSQFHGRFDEIPFSTVTSPPTSHYKVFYHVYAGKESGAYYQVYLKGIPESSYYQDTSSTLVLASGYAEAGGYASETIDRTAPSGYKELCISVNGQEECGFKEVSTSFAVDYISDEYVASQITETDITTEKQCVSGSASAYSLLNPNLQEGVGDLISPEIYNRGIIRVCATGNPGKGSDGAWSTEGSRWKEVGYCGDANIKCWLDTDNIKDIIEGTGIAEDALESVTDSHLEILKNSGDYLDDGEFKDKVDEIKEKNASEQLTLIGEIFDRVFWNREKGYLYLLRGNAYAELAIKAMKEEMDRIKEGGEDTFVVHYSISRGNYNDKKAADLIVDALRDEGHSVKLEVTGDFEDKDRSGEWENVDDGYDRIIVVGGPWPNKLNFDYCNCVAEEEGEIFIELGDIKGVSAYFVAGLSGDGVDTLNSAKYFIKNYIEEGELPSEDIRIGSDGVGEEEEVEEETAESEEEASSQEDEYSIKLWFKIEDETYFKSEEVLEVHKGSQIELVSEYGGGCINVKYELWLEGRTILGNSNVFNKQLTLVGINNALMTELVIGKNYHVAGYCYDVQGNERRKARIDSPTITLKPAKTYKINDIGFKVNGRAYWGEMTVSNRDVDVEIVVADEDNCEKVQYKIWWEHGIELTSFLNLENVETELNTRNQPENFGGYFIEASCYDLDGKVTKEQSEIITFQSDM